MGARVTAKDHYSFTSGTLANNYASVGYSYDDSGIQYPDHWGINLRVTIITDGLGASRITIGGLGKPSHYGTGLRLIVNQSADAYCKGATRDGVLLNDDGTGSADVTLSPNTTYYVWLVNNDAWPYYSHIYSDTDITVTASGSYGAPAKPSAINGTFGSEIGITLSGGSSGAKYTVTVQCAGRTETLATKASKTSYAWTPATATYAPLITNENSATATITVDTYYADVKVGTETKDITVSFAANSLAPACSSGWLGVSPYNTGAAAGFTGYVQGYSKARVSFLKSKITPQYGATIASFKIVCGGVTKTANASTADTDTLDTDTLATTSFSVACTVIDSRGQATTATLTRNVDDYAKPSLSEISVFRADGAGVADEDGNCVSARATANYSRLSGENSATLSACVRTLTGSFGAGSAMQSGTAKLLTGFSPDTAYEVKLTLTDRLGNTAEVTRRLPTRRWAMKFRPDGGGVAFGKAAEVNTALELGNGWALVLRDASGNAVSLNAEQLQRLLAML